jgi:hypothetical protein
MNFGHCPLCYDGLDSCRCSQSELQEYHDSLEKEKLNYKNLQRTHYRKLLDETFDRFSTFECETFPMFFAKEVFGKLGKFEYLELRKQFDKKFNVK